MTAQSDDRQALWSNLWGHFFRFGEKYAAVIFSSYPVFMPCNALSYRTPRTDQKTSIDKTFELN